MGAEAEVVVVVAPVAAAVAVVGAAEEVGMAVAPKEKGMDEAAEEEAEGEAEEEGVAPKVKPVAAAASLPSLLVDDGNREGALEASASAGAPFPSPSCFAPPSLSLDGAGADGAVTVALRSFLFPFSVSFGASAGGGRLKVTDLLAFFRESPLDEGVGCAKAGGG